MQFGDETIIKLDRQVHDELDFIFRACPVFGRKGVDRQIVDAQVLAVGAELSKCLRPRLVTGRAREAALLRPAAVAVHNYADIFREYFKLNVIIVIFFAEKSHNFLLNKKQTRSCNQAAPTKKSKLY